MVNVSKRMHKLMPKLWRVKGGSGASILPPKPPAPQLTSVVLRIPSPANAFDASAHTFWRQYLPALKYHNLTLPIRVEQKKDATPNFAPTLTLNFEATTKEALENQKTTPQHSDQESIEKWKTRLQQGYAQQRSAEAQGGPLAPKKDKNTWVDQIRKQQEAVGIPQESRTSIGDITVKPQPAADPSAPSSTSPPEITYQRSMTLGLRGRYASEIWTWFKTATGARPFILQRSDNRAIRRHDRFEKRAEEDRVRVKKGVDAMKREKEELKRAKEAAERLVEA